MFGSGGFQVAFRFGCVSYIHAKNRSIFTFSYDYALFYALIIHCLHVCDVYADKRLVLRLFLGVYMSVHGFLVVLEFSSPQKRLRIFWLYV